MAKRRQQHAHGGLQSAYGLKVNRRLMHPHRRNLLIASDSSFREARGHSSVSKTTPPLYYPMKQAAPMMLVFLTIKYQGKADTIFQENGVALVCLIAATLSYWLIVGKIKENTSCVWMQSTLWWAALASSLVSAISFVFILLPFPWLSSLVLLPLVMSSLFSVVLLYPFGLFVVWALKKMHGVFVWARGTSSLMEQV